MSVQLWAVHFDSMHRNRPMSSRLLFTLSVTMNAPVAVVGMGGCLAPYLEEKGHGVIAQNGRFWLPSERHFESLILPVFSHHGRPR